MKFLAKQTTDFIDSNGKSILVKKGEIIPEEFRANLLLHNRDFIADIEYKDGIPVLTPEEEKLYNVKFGIIPEQIGLEGKIKPRKYSSESLNEQLNELGDMKFKSWAEETFGKKDIDKRKSAKSIITQILKMQEEKKR